MGDDFRIRPGGMHPAADSLRDVSELIARAGRAVVGIERLVTGAVAGASVSAVLQLLADAWATACVQLVEGAQRLAELADDTAQRYREVDAEQVHRLSAAARRG